MRSFGPTESRMGARYQRLPAPPSAHRSHPRSSASPELGGTPLGTVTTMQAEFDDHAPEESLRSMHPRVAPDDEVAIVHGARPTTPNCPDDPDRRVIGAVRCCGTSPVHDRHLVVGCDSRMHRTE